MGLFGKSKAERAAERERFLAELAGRGWRYEQDGTAHVPAVQAQYDNMVPTTPGGLERGLARLEHPITATPQVRAGREVITGVHRGRPFLIGTFDEVYEGRSSQTRVEWVYLPAIRPFVSVRRTPALESAIRKGIGRGDRQLESEEFNKYFEIQSADDRFASDVLNPRMMAFLLDDRRRFRGFSITLDKFEVQEPSREENNVAELLAALDLRCDLLELIPDFVWR
ncbi:DUF3137 domain-containing protein [Sciscionella sediminilitoris]|uniref:DUF3137 domain-containing protein n=1 Tax=Sciscionella sediminilitoris TaxID=1445613 RepID=UPI00068FFCAE|nr:DUF3137 domain-containing protein [Sciscionella sp. SE31]